MSKRILACFIIPICMIVVMVYGYSATDDNILSDQIENEYTGRDQASDIIENITFSDVNSDYWAKEPITRLGALNIIKGFNVGNRKQYRPFQSVSNQEVLALLLRAIGKEAEAELAAEQINNDTDTNEATLTLWSKGYLKVASDLGIITQDDLDDALSEDQSYLDPQENFMRNNSATREQVAKWIVDTINAQNEGAINPVYNQQAIFKYNDWRSISLEFVPYVEAVVKDKIMVGSGNSFNPKKSVTRAELAQILKNLDKVLYDTMNIEKKGGVISYVSDESDMSSLTSVAKRTYLIRNNEGKVDKISYEYIKDSIDKILKNDVPVYKDGDINGLLSLEEGDYIEYLVDDNTKELLYIYGKGNKYPSELTGTLEVLGNINNHEISIKSKGTVFNYKLADGLYDEVNETLEMNGIAVPLVKAPISSNVTLTISNNLVTKITYEGGKNLSNEISGIVIENNTDFSYITITDWDGNKVTKHYRRGSIEVEKQNFYDEEDEIGYIDEMFPNFEYDEKDAFIEDIEAGDIVHIKLDSSNPKYITAISGKTNHIVKFGTIKEVVDYGAVGIKLGVQFNDLSISYFDIKQDIPVIKDNRNVSKSDLVAGDSVRLLINQAVVSSGTILETIKEIKVDEYGNVISNIYKGNLGTINTSQQKVTLLNVYKLSKLGWMDYNEAKLLDIKNKGIQFYKNGERISLSYANKYLRRDGMEVYVAMEEYYAGEKVTKVTFRDGRDSVLGYSNVTKSNGIDELKLISSSKAINLDDGTIIIKDGKMVGASSILSPDYAQVVLNGNNNAAIVNIDQEPINDAISVFRGRVAKIENNHSLQVQSHSELKDMKWTYSPISRIFTLNYDTLIMNENGDIIPQKEFITYSDISKVDEVYTIIAEGTKAKYIVKNDYAKEGVEGKIYELSSDKIMIKDVIVYNSHKKKWTDLSYKNSYAQVDIPKNSIIIKNNEVISTDMLETGDKIRVMTTEDLSDKLKEEGSRNVKGYIIFVEK